jgi:hypothetical protein
MPSYTIQAKFAFGDRVRFDSQMQRCSGEGIVFGITLDRYGRMDYLIEIDCGEYTELQAGILESEMVLVDAAA